MNAANFLAQHRPVGCLGGSRYFAHLNNYIGRNIQPPSSLTNRLRIFRLIEAVSLFLVGAEKRKKPVNPYVAVDLLDCRGDLGRGLNLFREIPLDQIERHTHLQILAKVYCFPRPPRTYSGSDGNRSYGAIYAYAKPHLTSIIVSIEAIARFVPVLSRGRDCVQYATVIFRTDAAATPQ